MPIKLNSPYPFETSLYKRWRESVLIAAFVFLFLLIFQPFGIATLDNIALISLGYGFCTFLVMLILNIGLIKLFPNFFSEEAWNTGRQILWSLFVIACIGIANAVYSSFLGIMDLSIHTLFLFEGYTMAIGFFPVAITVFINQNRLNTFYAKGSGNINTLLQKAGEKEQQKAKDNQVIVIPSENGKDDLIIEDSDLLFIRSADNYVEVFYLENDRKKVKLIRNSLKNVNESLELNDQFFRCHKSFLVNLKKIDRVSGNAQGYKFHLKQTDEIVPVSRMHNETIKERFYR